MFCQKVIEIKQNSLLLFLDLSLEQLMCIYKILINHPDKLEEVLLKINKSKSQLLDVDLRNVILEKRLKYYSNNKTVIIK